MASAAGSAAPACAAACAPVLSGWSAVDAAMTSLAEFCALVAFCLVCGTTSYLLLALSSLLYSYARARPTERSVPPHMKPAYYNGSAATFLCHCGDPVAPGDYHQTSARCRP